ncbi:MAG: hypothetical protein GY754_12575, partial [bacterium]|nr:hypothetical protein [bacterium]
MDENLSLLLVFFVLYFSECLLAVPGDSVILYSHFLKKWEYAFSRGRFTLLGRSLFRGNAFPPLGVFFPASLFPVAFSPEGFSILESVTNPGTQGGGYMDPRHKKSYRYEEIKTVLFRGKTLLINGEKFITLHSETAAAVLAENVKRIAEAPSWKRKKIIAQYLKERFNTKAIEEEYRVFEKKTLWLRFFTNMLLLYLVIQVPTAVYLFGLEQIWTFLLWGLFLLESIITLFFYRAYKRLAGEYREGPWLKMIIMFFYPPGAIRAIDNISGELFAGYHPVAVAQAIAGKDLFVQLATQVSRDLLFPGPGEEEK